MTDRNDRKPPLPPRWVIRVAWAAHRALYTVTRGRVGLRPSKGEKYGMLRLRTVGRRSGTERTAIVAYIEDGPRLVTLAMNGWAAPEPKWWLNLQAHPDATVELPGGSREVTARVATQAERSRLWPGLARTSRNLDRYVRLRPRETAVVIFEPRTPNR
jgi:F420H(2)-dependent quinone reductase